MGNRVHLELLTQGVEVWNDWREKNPGVIPDLEEADLGRASLAGLELREANLHRAHLLVAKLLRANFQGADLRGVNLRVADLREVNFKNANLQGAHLGHSDLHVANFRGADLQEANLRGVFVVGADFREANLRGADLQGTHLLGADLRGADFSGADLQGQICMGPGSTGRTWLIPRKHPKVFLSGVKRMEPFYDPLTRRREDAVAPYREWVIGPTHSPDNPRCCNLRPSCFVPQSLWASSFPTIRYPGCEVGTKIAPHPMVKENALSPFSVQETVTSSSLQDGVRSIKLGTWEYREVVQQGPHVLPFEACGPSQHLTQIKIRR